MFFEGEELVACFPAHSAQSVIYSHLGLTYAGLMTSVVKSEASITNQQNLIVSSGLYPILVTELIEYLKHHGFKRLEIKLPPPFFDPYFDEHYDHLFKYKFEITEESQDLVINLKQGWSPSHKKTAGYRNGKFDSLKIRVCDDFSEFWEELLIPQLRKRHNAKPTHSLKEIQLLQSRFPSQILQYDVEFEGSKIAGITLFDFGNILKVQYAAGNDIGFEKNAMDFLYLEIIKEARALGKQYVDLGTVNHRDGRINHGLMHFKKQLGAVVTPVIEIALDLRP
ncbi:hypothetical protein [Nonlabens marinus]|nr:hypothetical protein [Nonlabens marinus]